MDSCVAPAHSEVRSLRHPPSRGGWSAAIFIIFVEIAERFAYYGVSANLINYLTNVLGEAIATAAQNVNIWHGVSAVTPLVGAFVTDSYLGRFRTIIYSSVIYITGLVLLVLSVSLVPQHHRSLAFFIALYIITIGEGGFKPSLATFAADQFDKDNPEEKKNKSSFFNYWFLGVVCGASLAILAAVFAMEYIGWTVGFVLPTVAMALAMLIFLVGAKFYWRKMAPLGSPFTRVVQVFVAAVRKRGVSETRNGSAICYVDVNNGGKEGGTMVDTLARTNQFRFLDKAAIIDEQDATTKTRNNWRLCSINQVEEVKTLLHLVPVWLTFLIYAVQFEQNGTYFIKQATTMDRLLTSKFHLPAATLLCTAGITLLITIPLYDRVFVPFARSRTKHPSGISSLQRIGTGLFISILTMTVAALVESKRVKMAIKNGLVDKPKSVIPMSVFWLLPQYIISGLSETFTIIGMQELFYDQMPRGMKSMGSAAYNSGLGVGSFISSAIIYIIQGVSAKFGRKWLGNNMNASNLEYFYWVLAGLCCLNFCIFLLVSRSFVYKKVEEGADEDREMSLKEYPDGLI